MIMLVNWIFAGGSMVLVVLYVILRIQYRNVEYRAERFLDGFNDMVKESMRFAMLSKSKQEKIDELVQHNLELAEQLKALKKEEDNG
jgi:hypothetical protein